MEHVDLFTLSIERNEQIPNLDANDILPINFISFIISIMYSGYYEKYFDGKIQIIYKNKLYIELFISKEYYCDTFVNVYLIDGESPTINQKYNRFTPNCELIDGKKLLVLQFIQPITYSSRNDSLLHVCSKYTWFYDDIIKQITIERLNSLFDDYNYRLEKEIIESEHNIRIKKLNEDIEKTQIIDNITQEYKSSINDTIDWI